MTAGQKVMYRAPAAGRRCRQTPPAPPRRTVLEDAAQLGYVLRVARLSMRLTVYVVANRLRVVHSTVSYRETGKTEFKGLQDAIEHAAALGYRLVLEPADQQEANHG